MDIMDLFDVLIVPLSITIIGVLIDVFLNWWITTMGRKKEKPRFFVHELLFKGVSPDNRNNYQFVGRLIGTWQHNNYNTHTMRFRINDDCKWESFECTKFTKRTDGEWEKTKDKLEKIDDTNKTEKKLVNIEMGDSCTYSISGSYCTPTPNFPLKIVSETITSGDNNVEVIKCPNIRNSWLFIYFFISSLVLFFVLSIFWICYNNHILADATLGMKYVYALVGLFFLFIAVFSFIVIWRALKSYRIVREMKNYDIPYKKQKVTDKNLIPKILEYVTGTETIDNTI